MTTRPMRLVRNGARPLRSLQGGAAPGSEPQRSPPSATGGPSHPPCCASGRGRRATGRTKARKDKPFTIMHWNAESVMNKKTELEHILHEETSTFASMLHPGDASSVQQILQGEGLSVLQVRQNRPKQRRSTDSRQEHQRLSDRHSHGRL